MHSHRSIATVLLIASLAIPARSEASCGGSAGSGPQAACESIAHSDIWLYLWLDFMNIVVSGADLGVTWHEERPAWPVHPLNIMHHALGALTILAGSLTPDATLDGFARTTLAFGLTSEAIAIIDTVGIAARHHKRRRIEKRIEQGR